MLSQKQRLIVSGLILISSVGVVFCAANRNADMPPLKRRLPNIPECVLKTNWMTGVWKIVRQEDIDAIQKDAIDYGRCLERTGR